jgi:uncharacterized protein (TIGR02246 family)
MIRAAIIGFLLAVIATGARAQDHPPSQIEARKIADSIAAKYESATNAADADSLSKLYTEDATYFPAFGGAPVGRQAIKSFVAARLKPDVKVSITITDAQPVGNGVWAIGDYVLTLPENKSLSGHFVYVIVPDGTDWRIRIAISNSPPPPPK